MAAKKGKPERKILRIGIIQGGKIIEERLLRKRSSVTIGQSLKNTFVVLAPNLPKSFALFQPKGNTYVLSFTEQMDGRVSVKDSVLDFASLKSQNVAKKKGASWSLSLTEKSRGKVNFGDVILLFQFVTPPPEPAKPTLPAVARGGWVKNIDWVYSTILCLSLIAHSGFIAWMNTTPIPDDIDFEEIPDRFANLIVPEKKEEPKAPEKKKTDKGDEKKKEAKKEEKKEEPKKEKPKPEPKKQNAEEKARAQARRRAEMEKKVQGKGLLKVLGTLGDSGASGDAVADVFNQGGVDTDLDEVFEGTAGVEVATASSQQSRRGGSGGGKAAKIAELKTEGGGGGKVKVKKKKEVRVRGSIQASAPEVDGADLDPSKIARVVKARLSSVKSCYESQLKKNPSLKGKIVVAFVIQPNGKVSEVSIDSNSMGNAKVANCIARQVKRWRFPRFEGDEVPVAYPFVFSPSS